MIVSLPLGDAARILVEQGSTPLGAVVGGIDVKVTSRVGSASGVSVGASVGDAVSVGGRGVFVGMAAWVCATAVKAAATAVLCTSSTVMDGVAGVAPQATRDMPVNRLRTRKVIFFICLTVWVTTTFCNNFIVSNNNFPAALAKPESTRDSKVFFAIYVGQGRIIPNRATG